MKIKNKLVLGVACFIIIIVAVLLIYFLFSGIPREFRGEWIFSPEKTITLNENNPLWKAEYAENIKQQKYLRGYKITKHQIGATFNDVGLLADAQIIKKDKNSTSVCAKQGDKIITIRFKLEDHNTLLLKVDGNDFSDVYIRSK